MKITAAAFLGVASLALLTACERQPTPAPAPAPTAGADAKTAPSPAAPSKSTATPPATSAPATTPAPGAQTVETPAPASDRTQISGPEMVLILREIGYDADLSADNEGDPMIQGRIEGYKYTLFFYRCNKQAEPRSCFDLQFHASFTNDNNVNLTALNIYNRDNRFGQAFFAENGEIGLDMSATLEGGVSLQHIKEVVDWWKVTLTSFPKKISDAGGGNAGGNDSGASSSGGNTDADGNTDDGSDGN